MKQIVNKTFAPLFAKTPRYVILMGGRGAGRSTVASQYANAKLVAPEYFRCAIMRYILGDIRNSIYREITDRAEENGIDKHLKINDSTMSIEYANNSINAVGFRRSSTDQKSKLKSLANYNCVIIEEADEIPEEDFMQLDDSLRTVKGDITIILLLNPPAKTHWIIKRWFNLLPSGVDNFYIPELKPELTDTLFIQSSYLSNYKNIAQASIDQYENYKLTNPNHYYNMIKGYVPETIKGKIYSNWLEIDEVPPTARLERYGLDFGYSNDPTAIVGVYKWNNAIVLDEKVYKKGMLNSHIAKAFENLTKCLIIADSNEPKSIDELLLYGLKVLGAVKGQGSINQGIDSVQNRTIYVTKRSKNIWKEYDNYAWKVDKDGNGLNVPIDAYNHALDAVRYVITDLFPFDIMKKEKPEKPKGQQLLDKLKQQKGYSRSWR
jgi:phage terminase large subunit